MSENGFDPVNETIDPRVQIELERLNSATDAINRLEVDLDGARDVFRSLLCDSAARLDALSRKLGSCIEKARPYYEARIRASEAAREAQDAAVQYERANSAHSAAREMVYLAEQGLGGKCTLDPAWQEMLNHATQRVNEAETARAQAAAQHCRAGKRLEETSVIAQKLQRELRKSIAKSSLSARRNLMLIKITAYQHNLLLLPYFEMKAQFNQHLDLQKIKVQTLEKQVCNAKLTYAEALRHLEQISDEIHRNRKKSKANVYHEIDFKQKATAQNYKFDKFTNDANNKNRSNRYSDPIGSFPDYPYVQEPSSGTSVFYNQTYIPESQSIEKGFQFDKNLQRTQRDIEKLDEFKTLPSNISPKSSPIKVKNYPEEVTGYCNLPNSLNVKKTWNADDESLQRGGGGIPKSLTNEWTEINLDSSSPEDLASDSKNDIPYERFDVSPPQHEPEKVIQTNNTPKKRLLTKQMTLPATSSSSSAEGRNSSSFKSKMKLDSNISNWISRSSAKNEDSSVYNSRPTSEKVKEIFSHGIMMLNISSLTERRNSEPRTTDSVAAQQTSGENPTSKSNSNKKVPSPLEKTLTYLTSNTDEDTTGSDTDSLASCDMLTEEQIQSLMLDRDIDLVCEQIFGTPISEVCPKFATTTTATSTTTGANQTAIAAPPEASIDSTATLTTSSIQNTN
ncbi:uncharacterized protein LOC123300844 isoform X2 [Chrysoperla carnea]|uniref:uncharacterized protein LOC123300844 isoform X2 n=1 Tax=Chrysoperla carnea TaxID=189513 RepID=UPI001D079E19|nr:uncharacterized protein LOC123300844 isoform X2 [Chrysoperla carnea]